MNFEAAENRFNELKDKHGFRDALYLMMQELRLDTVEDLMQYLAQLREAKRQRLTPLQAQECLRHQVPDPQCARCCTFHSDLFPLIPESIMFKISPGSELKMREVKMVQRTRELNCLTTCQLCGEPMPPGEEVFLYHGYSGPCPKKQQTVLDPTAYLDPVLAKIVKGPQEKICCQCDADLHDLRTKPERMNAPFTQLWWCNENCRNQWERGHHGEE